MAHWLIAVVFLVVAMVLQSQQQAPWPLWAVAVAAGAAWRFPAATRLAWAAAVAGVFCAGDPAVRFVLADFGSGGSLPEVINAVVTACLLPIAMVASVFVWRQPIRRHSPTTLAAVAALVAVHAWALRSPTALWALTTQDDGFLWGEVLGTIVIALFVAAVFPAPRLHALSQQSPGARCHR